MKKTIINRGVIAVIALASALTGCRSDFDYDEAKRQNPEFAYKESFEKAFGTISPTQSWDFSRKSMSYSSTRSTDFDNDNVPTLTTSTDWYNVQSGTLKWLNDNLTEGNDHKSLGKSFTMTMPANTFTIVPIYQGQAGAVYELHLVFGDGTDGKEQKDVTVWKKGDNLQYKQYANSSWTDVGNGDSMNKNAVRAKSVTVDDIAVGTVITMYMLVTQQTDHDYAIPGTKQSSTGTDGFYYKQDHVTGNYPMILALPLEGNAKPTNIPNMTDKTQVMMIGCEVANCKKGDWDYNDAVFLIYGNPDVPNPIEITGDEVIKTQDKRYMVEDLGASEETDIDFNDVVIDVKRECTVKYVFVNGVMDPSKTTTTDWEYSATVKALGGTKNVSIFLSKNDGSDPNPATDPCIFVKDMYFPAKVSEGVNVSFSTASNATKAGLDATIMYNTVATNQTFADYAMNYDKDAEIATIDFSGVGDDYMWDPAQNNVYVVVYKDNQSEFVGMSDAKTIIKFPDPGTVPAMIAVDTKQQWNYERYKVFSTSTDAGYYLKLINNDPDHPELNNK